MSSPPHYFEQEDREAELERVRRLIHRKRDKDFRAALDEQSKGYGEWAKEECKQGRHEFSGGQCVHCGEEDWHIFREDVMDREEEEIERLVIIGENLLQKKILPAARKEWARFFLVKWNQAVNLWNEGYIFSEEAAKANLIYAHKLQQEYACICQSWLAPNGCVDPHLTAEGR